MSLVLRGAWLPNALSIARLLLVPVYVVLARATWVAASGGEPVEGLRSATLAVMVVSGITDLLDGRIARSWKVTSAFGAVADAAADKATQVAALATLTVLGPPAFPALPWWLLGSVLLRDLVLAGGWLTLRAMRRHVDVEHEFHGKLATVLVFGVVLLVTGGVGGAWLGPVVAVAAASAVWSAVRYAMKAARYSLPGAA